MASNRGGVWYDLTDGFRIALAQVWRNKTGYNEVVA